MAWWKRTKKTSTPKPTNEALRALRDRIWAGQQVEIENGQIARAALGVLLPDGSTQVWPVLDMERRDQICRLAVSMLKPVAMVMCYDGYISRAAPCPQCKGLEQELACETCGGQGYRDEDRTTRTDALVGIFLLPRPEGPRPTYRPYVRDLTGVTWEAVVDEAGEPRGSHYPQPE